MKDVTLYTKGYCPYCRRAKALLRNKDVAFTEFDVLDDAARAAEMIERSGGGRTVPQIFIGDEHIGGSDELVALDLAGDLDALLEGEPPFVLRRKVSAG